MLVWLDLETTGLDVKKDSILEVAAIVTNDAFEEVARFHVVTNAARGHAYEALHPAVRDMHNANGLWMESLRAEQPLLNTLQHQGIDVYLEEFIREHAVKVSSEDGKIFRPNLAGSSVHFDRSFLDRFCPTAVKHLHYRILDISAVNELVLRTWPDVWNARPCQAEGVHRAMPDIENSLAMARYYRKVLGPILPGVDDDGVPDYVVASHAPEPGAL